MKTRLSFLFLFAFLVIGAVFFQAVRADVSIITSLSATALSENSVSISWLAPSSLVSNDSIAFYDVRYSFSPITETDWANAYQASGEPLPLSPGTQQSMAISGLRAGTRYYFAVKSVSVLDVVSGLSNVASVTTLGSSSVSYARLSGVVVDNLEHYIPGVKVNLTGIGMTNQFSAESNATGSYIIENIPAGSYMLDVVPPVDNYSLVGPASVEISLAAGESLTRNIQLSEVIKSVRGRVLRTDGTAVTDAVVKAVSGTVYNLSHTDNLGNYLIKLNSGDWLLSVYPKDSTVANWLANDSIGQISFSSEAVSEDKILNLTVQSKTVNLATANLSGVISGANALPVQGVKANIVMSGSSFASSTFSDVYGRYSFNGLSAGSYVLSLQPSLSSGLAIPPSVTLILEQGSVLTKNFQLTEASKIISGRVLFADGASVSDATIKFYKEGSTDYFSADVDGSGNFSKKLSAGTWSVKPYPKNSQTALWYYADAAKTAVFSTSQIAESVILNFIVSKSDAKITGKVLRQDGVVPTAETIVYADTSTGRAGEGRIDANGVFSISLPAGTYNLNVFCGDASLASRNLGTYSLNYGQILNLGTINLAYKVEHIKGRVKNQFGAGLSGITVNARKTGGEDFGKAVSNASGDYDLIVSAGEWILAPVPNSSAYAFSEMSKNVIVYSGTVAYQDFVLAPADAIVSGQVVNSSNEILKDVQGWVSVVDLSSFTSFSGAISQGGFSFKALAGTYEVSLKLTSGSEYSPGEAAVVSLNAGQISSVKLAARLNNATVSGRFLNQSGLPITDISARVIIVGEGGAWQESQVNSSGDYSIKIAPGVQRLNYQIDQGDYLPITPKGEVLTLNAGDVLKRDIIATKADAVVYGKVTDLTGKTLAGIWVSADSRSFAEGAAAVSGDNFSRGIKTDSSGNFRIAVSAGSYYIHAYVSPELGYVNPEERKVSVGAGASVATDLILRAKDIFISGKVLLNENGTDAFVWAWSSKGGYTETNSGIDGGYVLSVSGNDTWHVQASRKIESKAYKSGEAVINIGNQSITQNISLSIAGETMPESAFIYSDTLKTLIVSNSAGVEVVAPPKSLGASGNVSLVLNPVVDLPSQGFLKVVGTGYEIEARNETGVLIKNFNSAITVRLPYTAGQLAVSKANAEGLMLGFWDETAAIWRKLENSIVDKNNNMVVGNTTHFTRFAILSPADTMPPSGPTKVSVSKSGSSIIFKWINPSDSDFYHSRLYRSEISGQLGNLIYDYISNDSQADENPSPGRIYYYTVKAVDFAGNESPYTGQTVVNSENLAYAGEVKDGSLIRCPNCADPFAIWIVKQVGNTKYIRHMVSGRLFDIYTHLDKNKVIEVSSLDGFSLSGWIRVCTGANGLAAPADKVYEINGDATKHWIDMTAEEFLAHGGSEVAIYNTNQAEMNLYKTGANVVYR